MKLTHEKNGHCRILVKNSKLNYIFTTKRKHNTKLEEKKTKKDPQKKNHAKVLFTQNYMFEAKEIKHCAKKC
jgi:hypothetical protein